MPPVRGLLRGVPGGPGQAAQGRHGQKCRKGVIPVAAVAFVVAVAAAAVLCKVALLESGYLIFRANILSQKIMLVLV